MYRSPRDEFAELPTSLAQARSFQNLGDRPLVVVTAERDAQADWLPLQDRMAALSTNSSHRVVPYTHDALVTDQIAAQTSSKPFATSSTRYGLRRIVASEFQEFQMPYVIGIVLSAGVAVFARSVGFDRDRAFYPTVMIVIASYYVLFAAMSGSVQTVLLESIVMTGFAIAAVVGFKSSAWIVVGALAGHGVFDALHGKVIENSGVPVWWPAWCLAYDLGAAASLAWLIKREPKTE